MSVQLNVRASTPGYAGLYVTTLRAGRRRFCEGRTTDLDTPTRFSLRDEDGDRLIDFELENNDYV